MVAPLKAGFLSAHRFDRVHLEAHFRAPWQDVASRLSFSFLSSELFIEKITHIFVSLHFRWQRPNRRRVTIVNLVVLQIVAHGYILHFLFHIFNFSTTGILKNREDSRTVLAGGKVQDSFFSLVR